MRASSHGSSPRIDGDLDMSLTTTPRSRSSRPPSDRRSSAGAANPSLPPLGPIFIAPEDTESRRAKDFLRSRQEVTIAVDGAGSMPLCCLACRASINFVQPDGKVLSRVEDLDPVGTAQTDESPSLNPLFRLQTTVKVTPKTLALVTITAIDGRLMSNTVVGHAPVPLWSKTGCFEVRLLGGEVNAVSDPTPMPLSYVRIRINEPDPKALPLRLFDYTEEETKLRIDRKVDSKNRPIDNQMSSATSASLFATVPIPMDLSAMSPYSPKRGVGVAIHGLHHMLADPPVLFKVIAQVDGAIHYTRQHDWQADVTFPRFLDSVLQFTSVKYGAFTHILFRVYKMNAEDFASEVAWCAVNVFDASKYLRFLPSHSMQLYAGRPPPKLLQDLKNKPVERVLVEWSAYPTAPMPLLGSNGKPIPRLVASIGDPARRAELMVDNSVQPPPATLRLERLARGMPPVSEFTPYINKKFQDQLLTVRDV